MNYKFDIRNNLYPYEKIVMNKIEFNSIFVESFGKDSIRQLIFKNFMEYIFALSEFIGYDYNIWINGSFISKIENPKDIDFVIFLDYRIIESNKKVLIKKFLNIKSNKNLKLDGYLVKIYPKEHKFSARYQSDLLYWYHWFLRSKNLRNKITTKKGFVELKIN